MQNKNQYSNAKAVKAIFSRKPPAEAYRNGGLPLGWVALSYHWFPDKTTRRLAHGHWYRITSSHGTVSRILRMSGHLAGSETKATGDIVIDWPAWLKLHNYTENTNKPLELEISRARIWHWPQLIFAHPDPTTKIAMQLGVLSTILGILSLALALW